MDRTCDITFETLLDYQEALLSESERERVVQHLATDCSLCQSRLQWISATLPLLPEATTPAPVPSAQALTYARNLARLLQPAARPQGWRRFVAQRQPEAQSLAMAGARGDLSTSLQQLYTTEVHLITLWDETETAQSHYLIGQIYERDGTPLFPNQVILMAPGADDRQAVREGSEFHLADVAPGSYAIRCRFDHAEIVLPEVEVGRS